MRICIVDDANISAKINGKDVLVPLFQFITRWLLLMLLLLLYDYLPINPPKKKKQEEKTTFCAIAAAAKFIHSESFEPISFEYFNREIQNAKTFVLTKTILTKRTGEQFGNGSVPIRQFSYN